MTMAVFSKHLPLLLRISGSTTLQTESFLQRSRTRASCSLCSVISASSKLTGAKPWKHASGNTTRSTPGKALTAMSR